MKRHYLAILFLALALAVFSQAVGAFGQSHYIPYQFSTFAGVRPGNVDGVGGAARFDQPYGLALDSAGNVFVADTFNNTIRKITPTGEASTFAGLAGSAGSADGTGNAARFNGPFGITVDNAGNIYVGDASNHTIRKITSEGVVNTLAGLAGSPGSTDGLGNTARFSEPSGVAVDSTGSVYVADSSNNTIRKITPGGVVSTLAGLAGSSGSAEGQGSAARFFYPTGVTADGDGNLYVADYRNHTVRKVTSAGAVSTLAGLAGNRGSTDGTGSAARFANPDGVSIDSSGNVYVADSANHAVRKITPDGAVTTLAGLAGNLGGADGAGSDARFWAPQGAGVDSVGNIYIADTSNSSIRKITPAGLVSTLAGLSVIGSADGTGSNAQFFGPTSVKLDSAGNIYVADQSNNTIRKITPAGVVSTLAGLAGSPGSADGVGSDARFYLPVGLALDHDENIYVADTLNHTVRKITPGGVVSTLAGSAGVVGSADGTGSQARFNKPHCLVVDSAGVIFLADSGNAIVRKITPAGVVTTLAGCPAETCGINYIGTTDGTGSEARFHFPLGMALDSAGNIYTADIFNHTVRKITSGGVVTTLAGLGGVIGSADGPGNVARFNTPQGIALDSAGNLYVTETGNETIRKISPDGVVSTIGGVAGSFGNVDGTGAAARFHEPQDVAVDNDGNLFVADEFNHTIRFGHAPPKPQIIASRQGEHVILTGQAPPGTAVDISATADLGTSFLSIATVTADTEGSFHFEDEATSSFAARFYRASLPASSKPLARPRRPLSGGR